MSQTIRNHLHAAHLHVRWPWVVPTLIHCHITHRHKWCRECHNWCRECHNWCRECHNWCRECHNWCRERHYWCICCWLCVMFSDESLFTLNFLDRTCGSTFQGNNDPAHSACCNICPINSLLSYNHSPQVIYLTILAIVNSSES